MCPGRFVFLACLRCDATLRYASTLPPRIFVFENPHHARALTAGVFLHLHEHGKTLRKRGARCALVVEQQDFVVGAANIAPDAGVVLNFDLELHGALHAHCLERRDPFFDRRMRRK